MSAPTLDTNDFQVLESAEADFEKMTWTFNLQANGRVKAGNHVVLLADKFMSMQTRLLQAEGILMAVRDTPNAHGLEERVLRYFDPDL